MVQQGEDVYIRDKTPLPPHSNAHYTSPILYPDKVLLLQNLWTLHIIVFFIEE